MTNKFYINSNNQSGGVTAGIINNFQARPQRKLTNEARVDLLKNLGSSKKITVFSIMGDQESFILANEMLNFLKSQNLHVEGVTQCIYTVPVLGVHVKKSESNTEWEIIIGSQAH